LGGGKEQRPDILVKAATKPQHLPPCELSGVLQITVYGGQKYFGWLPRNAYEHKQLESSPSSSSMLQLTSSTNNVYRDTIHKEKY
jgi:hypothetical protein